MRDRQISECMKKEYPLLYQQECLYHLESQHSYTDVFGIAHRPGLSRSMVRFTQTAAIAFMEIKESQYVIPQKLEKFACENINAGFMFNSTHSASLETIFG